MYAERPEFVDALADFVRGRPAQPVHAFLAQADAAMAHDAAGVLREIEAPTLITFGAHDLVCSTRFAEPLASAIGKSELVVFEHLSHCGLHEDPRDVQPRDTRLLLRPLTPRVGCDAHGRGPGAAAIGPRGCALVGDGRTRRTATGPEVGWSEPSGDGVVGPAAEDGALASYSLIRHPWVPFEEARRWGPFTGSRGLDLPGTVSCADSAASAAAGQTSARIRHRLRG